MRLTNELPHGRGDLKKLFSDILKVCQENPGKSVVIQQGVDYINETSIRGNFYKYARAFGVRVVMNKHGTAELLVMIFKEERKQ